MGEHAYWSRWLLHMGWGWLGIPLKKLIFGVKGLRCDIALAKSVGIAQQKTFFDHALASC